MSARRFRKRPVEIEAVQWNGDNWYFLREWTDNKFDVLYPDDRDEDPEATAQVFDELHSTWVLVYDGNWIIKGIKGEFYPCDEEVFADTYDEVIEHVGGEAEALVARAREKRSR